MYQTLQQTPTLKYHFFNCSQCYRHRRNHDNDNNDNNDDNNMEDNIDEQQ